MLSRWSLLLLLMTPLALVAAGPLPATPAVERVTTIAPFPRGLAMVGDDLYVLCRGRVRGAGGVTAEIEDQAGTIYVVDPSVTEPIALPLGDAVRNNGDVFAHPAAPLRLWDRNATPPEADRRTDRPYCTLRWHEATKSFYVCAFSGIDMPMIPGRPNFSKNASDAVLRFDTRDRRWHEVERHDASTWTYPHADPSTTPAPHGWLKGPDNCLVLGNWLYAAAKDNSALVRYDLRPLVEDVDAPAPRGVPVEIDADETHLGQSALAHRDGWLYVGFRTTSTIVRIRLDDDFVPVEPVRAELVARFEPWDPEAGTSADITDMDFDDAGRLYVVSAQPARVFRFSPDPANVFDARPGASPPWVDLATLTNNPAMKSENVMHSGGWLYVTSGDGYAYQDGADGTVYRVRIDD